MVNELTKFLSQFYRENKEVIAIAEIFSEEILLKRNEYFLKEGSTAKQLGFIAEGLIRYYYITESGEEVTRWVSMENEFVTGFSSFITQNKSVENIQAIKPTRMLITSKEKWDELFRRESFVRDFWTRSVEDYLVGMEARVYSLIALNAKHRYDKLFQDYPHLAAEVPNKYLASMLGIQSRHLSRLRSQKK
jgi:CRP-like cAMP-binding protein